MNFFKHSIELNVRDDNRYSLNVVWNIIYFFWIGYDFKFSPAVSQTLACKIKRKTELLLLFPLPLQPGVHILWIDGMWKSITITNSGHQLSVAAKYCLMAPNMCCSSVQTLLLFTLLAPRTLKWLLDFWKFVHSCPKKFGGLSIHASYWNKQIIFANFSMCVRYDAD